jgi:hypothetical protein
MYSMIALIGAKPGARGEQDDRLVGVLAQEEAAERPFDAQDLLLLHRAEDVVGELAAGQVADVQLELRLVDDGMRRVGHRVAAPGAVAQDELDVLAGAVLEQVVGGQLQANDRDVGRGPVDRDDAARQLPDRELARARHRPRFQDDVGLRRGLAGQDEAGDFLLVAERLLLMDAVDDAALEHAALARAAGAVAAAVGQADALADGGLQDRFVALDAEGLAARLDSDGERHRESGAAARRRVA